MSLNSKNVLVTGANGFVGKVLCRWLNQRGYRVLAAVRSADKMRGVEGEGVIVGDISAQTDWQLENVNTVVHLAARVHVMNERAIDPLMEYRAHNVAATERLAQQAGAAGVQRIIYVSSVKVNGEKTTADQEFSERDTPAPSDPYAVSKLEAEQSLRRIGQETGLEIVIVRPPLIYGAGVKGNFRTMLDWVYRGLPLPVAKASNRRSLIGVSNFADFLETCIRTPTAAGEIFLVSDGRDLSTPELLYSIAGAFRRPITLLPVPEALLRWVLRLFRREGFVDRLFGSLVVDSSHARQLLNWSAPVSIGDELADTVQCYLKER